MEKPVLSLKNTSISFKNDGHKKTVVHNLSFDVFKNEIVGIVGESGSGKSVTSLAIMQLLSKTNCHVSGNILFDGINLNTAKKQTLQAIRGRRIAMIFQEPMSALNPSMRCGKQVEEILIQHRVLPKSEVKEEVLHLFEKVKIPNPKQTFQKYPHELSGGQQQRIMIAMAIACKPDILIADEPTTALDVTVQKSIIDLLKTIQKSTAMSVIFISHDLSLVSEIANRTLVMYKGEIVEQGSTEQIFLTPKHHYTKALIRARPSLNQRPKRLPTVEDILKNADAIKMISKKDRKKNHSKIYTKAPLLEVVNLEKTYFKSNGLFGKKNSFKAVNGVSFKLFEGETLGLVGESGCGKSTLGKAILQLDKATHGNIFYKGNDLTRLNSSEVRELRKDIQIIFQDPFASLNPRLTVGQAIVEPMLVHQILKTRKDCVEKALQILEKVGLDADAFDRYPHQFSGGQRQRIGIARTIAIQPKLIVCDESVSALDISVQAQVLNLLNTLKEEFEFTYIFISHDLAVVKYMADQLLIMNKGKIVEQGESDTIYENPKKEYTKRLIDAIPKGL